MRPERTSSHSSLHVRVYAATTKQTTTATATTATPRPNKTPAPVPAPLTTTTTTVREELANLPLGISTTSVLTATTVTEISSSARR
ncbi:hypothetical protein TCDM_07354 [Trypanosoma cruzi Dm28c]|uniref:Uncharacterized protein n=1 Tax=Trypanosoma cruzi Dm28c TaxID=1416333 RepID=V5BA63_TRYCR|nr:hypothetical protein TCDM_07354 [Trypanosoma cruzi Dm28c]